MGNSAAVIGAGPAGLMAADVLSARGLAVTVYDAMPSPARKFLMAGKSGLNITKDEPAADFISAFGEPLPEALHRALRDFGPQEAIAWAEGLGQPLFTGSSGRVFPTAMKASPLLRAWLARLEAQGVRLERRARWEGWDGSRLLLRGPEGLRHLEPDVTILATGGASWPRLGSDGAWTSWMELPDLSPFKPANMGFAVDWSPHMARHFGAPVKGCAISAGEQRVRAEFVISARGLEGGGIYAVSRAVREGAPLAIDLVPDLPEDVVSARLSKKRAKDTLTAHLRKALRLDPARIALLQEFGRPLEGDLAAKIKRLELRHRGPRPIAEAISTAGGLRFDALDHGLMLRARPGVFAAGEMLDWEAPTGGYLITACLATGRHAALAACRWIDGAGALVQREAQEPPLRDH